MKNGLSPNWTVNSSSFMGNTCKKPAPVSPDFKPWEHCEYELAAYGRTMAYPEAKLKTLEDRVEFFKEAYHYNYLEKGSKQQVITWLQALDIDEEVERLMTNLEKNFGMFENKGSTKELKKKDGWMKHYVITFNKNLDSNTYNLACVVSKASIKGDFSTREMEAVFRFKLLQELIHREWIKQSSVVFCKDEEQIVEKIG